MEYGLLFTSNRQPSTLLLQKPSIHNTKPNKKTIHNYRHSQAKCSDGLGISLSTARDPQKNKFFLG
jgi:hypothetical protein